jgi:hypothetical protein
MKKHDESGCYGDGTLGHQHTREACADTLQYYRVANFISRGLPVPDCAGVSFYSDQPYHLAECYDDLLGEMSDNAQEEYAACAWLNEHAPFTGAYWGWQDGDFGLWPDEEEDYDGAPCCSGVATSGDGASCNCNLPYAKNH